MNEFLTIITSFPTVVLTALMALVLLFWISAILGAIDIDFFDIDGTDFDLDVDAHAHADVDADLDVDGHSTAGGIIGFLSALGLTGVPISVSMSLWVLFAWVLVFFGDHWVLSQLQTGFWADWFVYYPLALLLLIVCIVLTVPVTAITIRPMRGLFVTHQAQSSRSLVGEFCRIDSLEVSENFGYARIDRDGEDFRINVWAQAPNHLTKGDQALVMGYDQERSRYEVTAAKVEPA